MRLSSTLLLLMMILLQSLLVPQASAISENCSTEPSLDGSDTFGYNVGPTPTSDDFAMTGTGCVNFATDFFPAVCASTSGLDNVVCFTPTNNCDILIQTSSGGLGSSANIFSGTCQEPTSCLASASSPPPNYNSALIFPVSLTGGTQYCVVWERCSSASQSLTINQINGTDCGPLGPEPSIQSITSTTADGSYKLGASINVTVTFSENVTLSGGTLDVTLDTGDVVSIAAFTNSSTASATYTVGAGDTSADLDATALALNGGTLQDGAGNDATIALPATTIADGSNIVIDGLTVKSIPTLSTSGLIGLIVLTLLLIASVARQRN